MLSRRLHPEKPTTDRGRANDGNGRMGRTHLTVKACFCQYRQSKLGLSAAPKLGTVADPTWQYPWLLTTGWGQRPKPNNFKLQNMTQGESPILILGVRTVLTPNIRKRKKPGQEERWQETTKVIPNVQNSMIHQNAKAKFTITWQYKRLTSLKNNKVITTAWPPLG